MGAANAAHMAALINTTDMDGPNVKRHLEDRSDGMAATSIMNINSL
jgi:hypothetical protein